MSADNGIYVLKTPQPNGGFEYRVKEAHNIETIFVRDNPKRADQRMLIDTFGASQVFTDDLDAFTAANDMLLDIEQEGGEVEYGVLMIELDQSFPLQ